MKGYINYVESRILMTYIKNTDLTLFTLSNFIYTSHDFPYLFILMNFL